MMQGGITGQQFEQSQPVSSVAPMIGTQVRIGAPGKQIQIKKAPTGRISLNTANNSKSITVDNGRSSSNSSSSSNNTNKFKNYHTQ